MKARCLQEYSEGAEMNKENIVTLKSPYRADFQINGYRFGKGEKPVV